MKTCTKCGETKSLSEFYKYSRGKDGHKPMCILCACMAAKKWRDEHIDMARERDRLRYAAAPEKKRQYAKAWYARNKVQALSRNREYAIKNKERLARIAREWRAKNRAKVNEYSRALAKKNYLSKRAAASKYRINNKDKYRLYAQNRRFREISGGTLSKGISDVLYKLQSGRCAFCKKPLGNKFHLDHIMPLALGGSNTDDNIQLLHASCNRRKNSKHPVDFMQQHGFLL